jgi:NADPH-dependent ferric siderophore reductase
MSVLLERGIAFDSAPVTVTGVYDVSAHVRRVTFSGVRVADAVTAGPDQRIKLLLPPPGRALTLPAGAGWYQTWLATPVAERVVMRAYTVRALRPEVAEIDVDFALHGRTGPASAWALDVRPGDTAGLLLPFSVDTSSVKGLLRSGVDYVPPADSVSRLLVADETALPALEGILGTLPAAARATAFVRVPDPDDVRYLPSTGIAEVTWLTGGAPLDALRRAVLPGDLDYAWIAGESGMVTSVRRLLVALGMAKDRISFQGYWRRGRPQC